MTRVNNAILILSLLVIQAIPASSAKETALPEILQYLRSMDKQGISPGTFNTVANALAIPVQTEKDSRALCTTRKYTDGRFMALYYRERKSPSRKDFIFVSSIPYARATMYLVAGDGRLLKAIAKRTGKDKAVGKEFFDIPLNTAKPEIALEIAKWQSLAEAKMLPAKKKLGTAD